MMIVLAVCAGSVTNASDSLFSFEKSGVLSSGAPFAVTIEESAYSPRPGELPDDGGWWGIDGGYPATRCSTFEVLLDGKPVFLVRKLFQDLADLRAAEVSEQDGKLIVRIRGGDGAGSYEARFALSAIEVERFVHAGEFADEFWERTVFRNSIGEEVD